MKNKFKSLILVFLCFLCHETLYAQGETVVFLDIANLDGEYTVPITRPVVTTPGPKQKNILIDDYLISKTNTINIGNATSGAGKATGTEMELNFRIDQSVIELSKRLFNRTITPSMNLFIDSPAYNGDPQRERMRIKLTNVNIISIDQIQDGDGIPKYKMKIRFQTNLTAFITYNFDYSTNTVAKYCWDYSKNSACTNDNF